MAAQSLSHIPASKRCEHLVLKRLGLTSGMPSPSPSTSAKKAYKEIFNGDRAHMLALCELFSADGEVGARKQRCRGSATQAYAS